MDLYFDISVIFHKIATMKAIAETYVNQDRRRHSQIKRIRCSTEILREWGYGIRTSRMLETYKHGMSARALKTGLGARVLELTCTQRE